MYAPREGLGRKAALFARPVHSLHPGAPPRGAAWIESAIRPFSRQSARLAELLAIGKQ